MLIQAPGPKLDELAIRRFETDHAIEFPADYRRFLLECNGGKPFPDAFLAPGGDVEITVGWFYSLEDRDGMKGSLASLWADPMWTEAVKAGYLPIADDTGNQPIIMKINGSLAGRIVIEINGNYHFAAASFEDLLCRLEKREGLACNFLSRIMEESIMAKPEEERGYQYRI
jgi:hypothetical protein